MKELDRFLDILDSVGLFKGIEPADLRMMLTCLNAGTQSLKKGKIILLAGDKPEYAGIILSGQVHITREDYNGNRSLVAVIMPGGIFAEALCCAGVSESPVTVVAAEDSFILKLGFERILKTCSHSCSFHKKLIENMLELIAKNNLMLQSRMEILELKTVREKILLYLESFSAKQGKNISIPLNREEMADFLGVERSALSHELAKMKNDGLIEYRKNRFVVKGILYLHWFYL